MAGLDDLYSQIPVADIAAKLGAPEGEVNQAIQTLVPTLVGGIQHNVASDDIDSSELESAIATGEGAGQGEQMVARIFGGNDTNQVASALAGSGAGGGDLIKKLLPILIPIVLAYLGKQSSVQGGTSGGGLGDVLGSILGGAGGGSAGGDNPLGSILGSVLGGQKGGAIGDILGGLLGGKK
ncbi:hypothetical protein FHT40_002829 [Mycolicibacterium sp. BK556]|uniref:DUF937 domain-containing protein n=1 Tax=unclassified Mycolicibacterium TaxID=2636767 RepID=UPI00160F1710|nr:MULTISPECIES: DUF937 domain-containing protein [unclassified Mycolicibacterium]MBB3603168.1 hypothetical protein [Mycolicibacterium sp. BK556]MBB3633363.1 hypothetical protein [Mycolicibacterium sp. BK607]MBB3750936.1 hypothetical protein [Mycolicibacterium sp. BK634]